MVALRKNREGGYGQPVDCWAMGLIVYIMYESDLIIARELLVSFLPYYF